MSISNVSSYNPTQNITPPKAAAPTPPPGGNVENRQPPTELKAPPQKVQAAPTNGRGSHLDVTV